MTANKERSPLERELDRELDEAEKKAWDSLARYKFQMFGYWAAIWVHLNRLSGQKRPNPWKALVHQARYVLGRIQLYYCRTCGHAQRLEDSETARCEKCGVCDWRVVDQAKEPEHAK